MKKITLGTIMMFLLIFTTSCNKDDVTLQDQLASVSFDISNFNNAKNKSDLKKGQDDYELPKCVEGTASYVEMTINGKEYTLKVLSNLGNGTETEVVKLPEGKYSIGEFAVFTADNTPLWAAVTNGSYYDEMFNLKSVALDFTIESFKKQKVEIDVLCYQPFDYQKFGFDWFQFAKIEVKTVCFFGDVCTKFFEDFHTRDGSPYVGQEYDGYDFAAIFDVNIYDGQKNLVNSASNLSWKGVGQPLCIEYPDAVGVDETFTFEILLYMPYGTTELIYEGSFTDKQWAEEGNAEGFGGADGVFDFVVGNCSYDGNDADEELPAYIPVPKSVSYKVSNVWGNGETYLNIEFKEISPIGVYEIEKGEIYQSFCGDKLNYITPGTWYSGASVYSSLDVANLPTSYTNYEWGALNWLVNNMNNYTDKQRQNAIWNIIHNKTLEDGGLSALALTHPNFKPTVGDYAIVLFDANAGNGDDIQLQIVRIDP